MIKESEIFRIGALGKPHGIHGEISFLFDSDVFDRYDCPYLILKVDGIFVPFFIEEYRFKGKETALITFQDINDEEQATRLQGLEVFFPKAFCEQDLDEDETIASWEFFIGFKAIDKHLGVLGDIIDVDTQTMNTLFMIAMKDDEVMIPAAEELILGIDNDKKEILLELPEGMFD